MDNNKFPPLEPEKEQPEVLPEIPEQMQPPEDLPVIEELSFVQETPEEKAPEEPVATAELSEDAVLEESTPLEILPEAAPAIAEEITPPVEAEAPENNSETDHFSDPITHPEILSDHQAMDLHGMTAHGEDAQEAALQPGELPQTQMDADPVPEEETPDQAFQDNAQDFDAMMHAPAPQEPKKQPVAPAVTQKGRPKRKKGEGLLGIPSILATFVWLALIVMIGVTAGRMLWICAADVLAFGREDKVVTVTIYEADTMEDIIDKLHEGGLIRYKGLFRFYAGISDAQEDIQPGIYDLNTRYDYHALVNFMSPRSSREVITLTIPEGYTCRQIFSLLEENRICTAVDAAAYAASGELPEYWFLEGVERGSSNCLEGYLFPDTYEFYKNSTPREALERMLDNFDYRFDEEMFAQLETLNKKVTDGSYGIREIVIIASLIEKESAAPGESPRVSGVIYNRLFSWGSNPPYLNIDASIVYAQEGDNARIDTSLDSPYNTYLYEGLTPGPIANPGLSSLKAALNPESHNYYYYVLNPGTGMHQFSTTYEEHSRYVREFAAATEES